jgi:hypothetical protein
MPRMHLSSAWMNCPAWKNDRSPPILTGRQRRGVDEAAGLGRDEVVVERNALAARVVMPPVIADLIPG